jgi:hypothetical protein
MADLQAPIVHASTRERLKKSAAPAHGADLDWALCELSTALEIAGTTDAESCCGAESALATRRDCAAGGQSQ